MFKRFRKVQLLWLLAPFALVAVIPALALNITSHDAQPVAAAPGDVTQVMWGDSNCDGAIDVLDVLATEQALLEIPQTSNQCGQDLEVGTRIVAEGADSGTTAQAFLTGGLHYQGYFGDVDCDGQVKAFDALVALQWIANLSYTQTVGCSPFTYLTNVSEIIVGNVMIPGPITSVGIDMNTSGNQANSLGATDTCLAPTSGSTFNVDVYAKGVPPFVNYGGGLGGFDFTFVYDPSQVVVTAVNDSMMLATGAHNIVSYTDSTPDTDGYLHVRAYDLSNNPESGEGVLARITLNAVGQGISTLSVVAQPPAHSGVPQIVDNENWIYLVSNVYNAAAQDR